MESKHHRLSAIVQIIQQEKVNSQDQLLGKLRSQGFEVTQATLSRDLKHLKIAKIPGSDGKYQYVLPDDHAEAHSKDAYPSASSPEGFLSLEFSGNLGIIKTIPAYSYSIALIIDKEDFGSIAGTVSGNDTVIFVIREGYTQEDVRSSLISAYPGLFEKIK